MLFDIEKNKFHKQTINLFFKLYYKINKKIIKLVNYSTIFILYLN